MKTAKKLTALLLAVVMVLAMSVSAFAATTSTATIQVIYGGEPVLDAEPVSFEITTGMTAKDALDQYADMLELTWKTVPSTNPGFGSTAYAVDTILGVGSEPVGSASGIPAVYWSTTYAGYGLEYSEGTGDDTVYHFIYVGDDWKFTVNGSVPLDPDHTLDDGVTPYQYYMDQYTVQAGDAIVVEHTRQIERWTGTSDWISGT